MIVKGKYNKAKVFTDVIEQSAIDQLKTLCDCPAFANSKIRIMPDVHTGAGCTIGTTMTITDKVVPHMVGVDIGCGMEVVQIAQKNLDFAALDQFIKANIPAGKSHRNVRHPYTEQIDLATLKCARYVNVGKGYLSLGTLGGGNHFIEVDKDDDGNLYIVIHSGSRHLGLEVAEQYQYEAQKYHATNGVDTKELIARLKSLGRDKDIEKEIKLAKKKFSQMEKNKLENSYLEGELLQNYLHDMAIMQRFADLNRKAMVDSILDGLGLTEVDRFTTIHNYIDLDKMILRKGAVSAQKGEKLLIPLNMRDGSLICIGKGNEYWNCSAPHGAGRLMSRTKAQATLSLVEFEKQMQGIYSTTVNQNTLDESPMAYKSLADIVDKITPTVKIAKKIVPVYNFKSCDDNKKYRNK